MGQAKDAEPQKCEVVDEAHNEHERRAECNNSSSKKKEYTTDGNYNGAENQSTVSNALSRFNFMLIGHMNPFRPQHVGDKLLQEGNIVFVPFGGVIAEHMLYAARGKNAADDRHHNKDDTENTVRHADSERQA